MPTLGATEVRVSARLATVSDVETQQQGCVSLRQRPQQWLRRPTGSRPETKYDAQHSDSYEHAAGALRYRGAPPRKG